MEINENKEVINLEKVNINDLIDKIEKDPLPTNIFETEETDPLVLLGKLNEVVANLKGIKNLISSSDNKSTEALAKALDAVITAGEALSKTEDAIAIANGASVNAQEAISTAESLGNQAIEKAENAIAIANGASVNAQEAISTAESLGNQAIEKAENANEQAQTALQTSREALQQVAEGLGTKVFNTNGELLPNAKFEGGSNINVKMDETDPEKFKIELTDDIPNDIVNLTEMLSATEELAQTNTEDISKMKPKISALESMGLDVFFLNTEYRKWEKNPNDIVSYMGFDAYNPKTRAYQGNARQIGIGSDDPVMNIYPSGSNILWVQTNIKRFIKEWGNGYFKFDDGTIVCWGISGSVGGTTWVNLPVAFTNTGYVLVVGMQEKINKTDWDKSTLVAKENNRFQITNGAYSMKFNFLAIGN